MTLAKALITVALLALCASAQAHTHLKSATPAEGSTVKAPEQITLNFSGPARLTALTLQKDGDDKEQKIAPLPEMHASQISVPAPKLTPGKYLLNWRIVSSDSHVMSGKLHFTVAN
jgi:copper resistance protein C